GPTDVAVGCLAIFLAYGLSRIAPKTSAALVILGMGGVTLTGCVATKAASPVPSAKGISAEPIWLAKVKNSTEMGLLLPATNPLRSLAEMSGKVSSDSRQSVMDLLREELRKVMEQKGYSTRLPEETDARFPPFPVDTAGAVRLGREGKLSGVVLASEIRRWEATSKQFVRVLADFKLLRLEDGAVLWERRVQNAVPTPSATDVRQAYMDAVKTVVGELFS
ncbi:MAG TPA: hypothetical protein VFS84_00640, partial [Candidatus Binatia bacterium]|nr:hypothetical protein [Candidatus Binatia bacterium]